MPQKSIILLDCMHLRANQACGITTILDFPHTFATMFLARMKLVHARTYKFGNLTVLAQAAKGWRPDKMSAYPSINKHNLLRGIHVLKMTRLYHSEDINKHLLNSATLH